MSSSDDNEHPALFVPNISQYTTVEDIIEYNNTTFRTELTPYINAAAQCIDKILKTPAKDIDWDHYEHISSYSYTTCGYHYTTGSNVNNEHTVYILIKTCYYDKDNNFKPTVNVYMPKLHDMGISTILNKEHATVKAKYIIEALGGIFGPTVTGEETDNQIICYIPFPSSMREEAEILRGV